MYDVYSKHADDFINHEEILETLSYADENKANEALIDSILEKARLRKGLSHREASVLLACQMEEKNQEIYKLAEQIKKDFYGNRIVMFAPLYLSNYCVNGCTYCPYHLKNKHIARKQLTQEEIRREVIEMCIRDSLNTVLRSESSGISSYPAPETEADNHSRSTLPAESLP